MKTSTRYEYVMKLPMFLQRAFGLRHTDAIEYDIERRELLAVGTQSVYSVSIGEEYMYVKTDVAEFSDILLYNKKDQYRMFSVCYKSQVIVINPYEGECFFFSAGEYAVTKKDFTFSTLDSWVKLDAADIELLGINLSNFIKLDFEDFIFNNQNLSEENIAYLFLKYK